MTWGLVFSLVGCAGSHPSVTPDESREGDDRTRACPEERLECAGDPDGTVVCYCRELRDFCAEHPNKCDVTPPPTKATVPPPPAGEGDFGCVDDNGGSLLLGPAAGFNVFVLGDLNQQGSDTEGRMAVGGHATLAGYSIGNALSNSHGQRDDLIVGGDLSFQSGSVANGNVVHAGSESISAVAIPNGESRKDSVIDFPAAAALLTANADALAALPQNGVVTSSGGNIQLEGAGEQVNIFSLAAEALASASSLTINTPGSATVIVNVAGSEAAMRSMGVALQGAGSRMVLFNFHQARQLTIEAIGVQGSVLAPRARVYFDNGHVNGNVVAGSISGSGESHQHPFEGCIPESTVYD